MEIEKLLPRSDPFTDGLANLGMGEPAARFAVGTAVGALGVWALRPSAAFYSDGSAKPWSFTAGPGEEGVPLPWWGIAVIPGILFSVFL